VWLIKFYVTVFVRIRDSVVYLSNWLQHCRRRRNSPQAVQRQRRGSPHYLKCPDAFIAQGHSGGAGNRGSDRQDHYSSNHRLNLARVGGIHPQGMEGRSHRERLQPLANAANGGLRLARRVIGNIVPENSQDWPMIAAPKHKYWVRACIKQSITKNPGVSWRAPKTPMLPFVQRRQGRMVR